MIVTERFFFVSVATSFFALIAVVAWLELMPAWAWSAWARMDGKWGTG